MPTQAATAASVAARAQRREAGRAHARAWRARMKPFFDALYGPEPDHDTNGLDAAERRSLGRHRCGATNRRSAEFSRQRAARYRAEQPFKAMLDRLYGPEA